MHKRLIPVAAAILAVSFAGQAPAQSADGPDLDQVVAVVNGTIITLGHVAAAKTTLPEQYQSLPADVLFPGIIDQLIQQTVLQQAFEGDLPRRVTLSLDNETRSLVAAEVVESIMTTAVTDELVEETYQAEYGSGEQGNEYSAAHILVETEETALEIKKEIEEGADFATLAQQKSTGPSGPRGGDLGWFGTGVMVPTFEQAVLAMEPGDVSDPIETQFGWHVIKLNEIRIKEAPAIEEVRTDLEQQIRQDAVSKRIEGLMETAEIDREGGAAMEASILNDIDLSRSE